MSLAASSARDLLKRGLSERRLDPKREARIQRMREEVKSRIACVCQGWPEEEVDRLADRIARINLKFLMRRSDDMFVEARNRIQRQDFEK